MQTELSDGRIVHFIGDPHLGKRFEVGVPAARLGERERKQMVQFRSELETDADVIVMVGDLFDHPYVSNTVVLDAARAVIAAAEHNPDTDFVMMAGNHDVPRNMLATGAWQVFTRQVEERLPNLFVVTRPVIIDSVAYFPWQWGVKAVDQIQGLPNWPVELAVGHWDLKLFDGKDDHFAPVKALLERFGEIKIYSGHYHVPDTYIIDGHPVACTGSMQPYSHAEDPESRLYITLPLSEAVAAPDGAFRDMCVRVQLKPGEEKPELDALAVTVQRIAGDQTTRSENTSDISSFSWSEILRACMEPLHADVKVFIEERISTSEAAEE